MTKHSKQVVKKFEETETEETGTVNEEGPWEQSMKRGHGNNQ